MDQIQEIKERNKRVELDKARETSFTRRSVIAVITYGVATLFMYRIGIPDPYLNAFVPTGGYILSTLSLPIIKQWWLKKYDR